MNFYSFFRWHKNFSIVKKFYLAAGAMAVLIAFELFILFVSMHTLSSARALVAAEGRLSKVQKNAVYYLVKYARSKDENDYRRYVFYIAKTGATRKTLNEINNGTFNEETMRENLLAAGNNKDDIGGLIKLFKRFHNNHYLKKSISIANEAVGLMLELKETADKMHSAILVSEVTSSDDKIDEYLNKIDYINARLTELEYAFSVTLGDGSKWLENRVLIFLFLATLVVVLIGLYLAVSVILFINSGIKGIIRVVTKISKGDFGERASVFSRDEIGMLAVCLNKMIDELEQSINAIKEGEEQIQSIFNYAPDAVIVINDQGLIVRWNPKAEAIFGWTAGEVVGRPLHEVIIPERFREGHKNGLKRFMQTKEGAYLNKPLELPALRKDQSEFAAGLNISPTVLKGKYFFIGFVTDITYRKRSEVLIQEKSDELLRSNKELEQFAYVASHDLQEPLRIITGYVQLLEKKYKGRLDSDADEFIHFIVDATARMYALINDLLTYSRVGSQGKEFRNVNCNSVVKAALENLKATVEEKKAKITIDNLPEIYADEMQMIQVFQNVIGNGIKFTKDRIPEIKISVQDKKTHWQFSVSDNGIGIQKEYLEKVFVIFQRLHTIAEYPGTGIGLAICKKIVERHGGKIWAESEFGKGSTFYFTIKKQ